MNTYNLFLIGILLVCFLLVLVIMVQNPKGGGLSSTFGGGANTIGGVKKTGDFLDKSTWVLATILVALILLSNTVIPTGNTDSKLLEGQDSASQQELPTTPAQDNADLPVNDAE